MLLALLSRNCVDHRSCVHIIQDSLVAELVAFVNAMVGLLLVKCIVVWCVAWWLGGADIGFMIRLELFGLLVSWLVVCLVAWLVACLLGFLVGVFVG